MTRASHLSIKNMSSNIVVEWLRSLHLGQYSESFLDNGYDDLEICKQVGDPDLDAIGVFNPAHRNRLLNSVRTLREEGAASVYFTLEETAAFHDECVCDSASGVSSRTSSGRHGSGSEKENSRSLSGPGAVSNILVSGTHSQAEAGTSPAPSSAGSAQELGKYLDDYEDGKQELVRIPILQFKMLLRDKLSKDGIRLSQPPYSNSVGERGYLEGLASRYADLFSTHYGDVLDHLEELRQREWADLSPRIRVLAVPVSTSNAPSPSRESATPTPTPAAGSPGDAGRTPSSTPLTTSQSQPIYVPGKYSPSSCLSDKEEDEIYGFAGYGVYGKQMLQRQQAARLLVAPVAAPAPAPSHAPPHAATLAAYQSCLSPRSAYFYEFPPNEHNTQHQTCKKKTPFSRLLRGLKTSHRKDKGRERERSRSRERHQQQLQQFQQTLAGPGPGSGSPRRVPMPLSQTYSRVGTADGDPGLLPHLLDPSEYDRIRFLQLNGAGAAPAHSGFEETIHRLKVQEALKQKERYHKEHEEILRDIRHGLLQLGHDGAGVGVGVGVGVGARGEETYMYDTEVRCVTQAPLVAGQTAHWYDEPPYESDPEDFLMGPAGSATIRNGRVCLTLNLRPEMGVGVVGALTGPGRSQGVISLRSAGDISVPGMGSARARGAPIPAPACPRRGLLLPQAGPYPATLIPLRENRESGDYASSDIQSESSRISTLSMDTARSEHHLEQIQRQEQLQHQRVMFTPTHSYRTRQYQCRSSQSEGTLSPSRSPDCEDIQIDKQITSDGSPRGTSLVGRMRGLRQDVQRKISRLRATTMGTGANANCVLNAGAGPLGDCAIPLEPLPSASSLESLPSGSGSSTQALVPGGSNHSSLSPEDGSHVGIGPVIAKARALVDYSANAYDKDALKFKKGEIIDVLSMNASGLWRGALNGQVGYFKFINVELVPSVAEVDSQAAALSTLLRGQRNPVKHRKSGERVGQRIRHRRGRPRTVEELLRRVNLEECISVFVLNGYDDVDSFRDLREEHLTYLGIKSTDARAKIRAAVQLLHDYDSPGSNEETDVGDPTSSNGEDEDDDDEDDNSSCSDLSGRPLPLTGKFNPSVPAFHRLQFPRDSGCYEADSRWTHHKAGKHHSSRERHHRRALANNLDSRQTDVPPPAPAPQSGSREVADLQGAQNYFPNIPVGSVSIRPSIDSYVVARGKVVSVEPCRPNRAPHIDSPGSRNAHVLAGQVRQNSGSPLTLNSRKSQSPLESPASRSFNSDKNSPQSPAAKGPVASEYLKRLLEYNKDSLEKQDEMNCSGHSYVDRGFSKAVEINGGVKEEKRLCHQDSDKGSQASKASAKYGAAGNDCDIVNHGTVPNGTNGIGNGGAALSEKSSDSGVSSSSLSSHPTRDSRKEKRLMNTAVETSGQ